MKDLKKTSSYLENLGNSGSIQLGGFNVLNVRESSITTAA